ncbi:hypothetical protein G7Y79_00033g068440 [Physcia stellaris]|nr:hypothetical protein G7Y79_00033g068440 [Physcia stellaris]
MDTMMDLEQALDFIEQELTFEFGTECNSRTSTIPNTLMIEEAESEEDGPATADLYQKMYKGMTKRDFLALILTEGVAIDRIVVRSRQEVCLACEYPPEDLLGVWRHEKRIYKHKGRSVSPQHQKGLDIVGLPSLFGPQDPQSKQILRLGIVRDFLEAHVWPLAEEREKEQETQPGLDRMMAVDDPSPGRETDLMIRGG